MIMVEIHIQINSILYYSILIFEITWKHPIAYICIRDCIIRDVRTGNF